MSFTKSYMKSQLAAKHEMQIIFLSLSFISVNDECLKCPICTGKNDPKTSCLQGCFSKCNGYYAGTVPA
jgi:hypothetical protein